jgi:hypothetical protein
VTDVPEAEGLAFHRRGGRRGHLNQCRFLSDLVGPGVERPIEVDEERRAGVEDLPQLVAAQVVAGQTSRKTVPHVHACRPDRRLRIHLVGPYGVVVAVVRVAVRVRPEPVERFDLNGSGQRLLPLRDNHELVVERVDGLVDENVG